MKGRSRKPSKIRRQMLTVYVLALLLPVTVVSAVLLSSVRDTLNEYYIQLLETDNRRVKMLLTEMTVRTYELSDEVCFSSQQAELLSAEYSGSSEFIAAVNADESVDSLGYTDSGIAGIYIYTDNPTVKNYKYYKQVTEETVGEGWYSRALETTTAFWTSISDVSYSGSPNNLCLVRQILLADSPYHAVAVFMLSDSYIRSWVDSGSVIDAVSLDDGGIVYSSRKTWYGQPQVVDVDREDSYFRSSGLVQVGEEPYYAAVSTINLHMTGSRLYVCSLDNGGMESIDRVTRYWTLVLILALLLPGVIILIFAGKFSGRVMLLREQMHQASQQNYNIISDFGGSDELAEAFDDLNIMIRDIQEKDARMYEAELKEQDLVIRQQLMEYKMLSAQINPHYLYNTLETIRMKALTMGNRDVADAIKLLGKTLHYVLENTGTAMTTLRRELDHVENYLAVQKLRFGDRINYSLQLQPGLEERPILPLLLQPVVENAVVHGLETVEGSGRLSIAVWEDPTGLHIDVRDNGVGMTAEQVRSIMDGLDVPQMPRSSIALYNIHQRIRLRYGGDYGIRVESTVGQGTCVGLHLPAESPKSGT